MRLVFAYPDIGSTIMNRNPNYPFVRTVWRCTISVPLVYMACFVVLLFLIPPIGLLFGLFLFLFGLPYGLMVGLACGLWLAFWRTEQNPAGIWHAVVLMGVMPTIPLIVIHGLTATPPLIGIWLFGLFINMFITYYTAHYFLPSPDEKEKAYQNVYHR